MKNNMMTFFMVTVSSVICSILISILLFNVFIDKTSISTYSRSIFNLEMAMENLVRVSDRARSNDVEGLIESSCAFLNFYNSHYKDDAAIFDKMFRSGPDDLKKREEFFENSRSRESKLRKSGYCKDIPEGHSSPSK